MKTAVERIKPTRVKLTIEVTAEELKPAIDHAFEHIARDVNIPGFRKGKVPPAILERRVGRPAILAHAINDGLDEFYRKAIEESKLKPIGKPTADIKSTPDDETWQGDLVFEIEVEVRPEIKLPDYKNIKVKVHAIEVAPLEVDDELANLRSRFGTLKTVDRPARRGDFTSIDLAASIDGKLVDSAQNISYEIGSGNLLDGIDEALDTLTAGESTTFKSVLVGGEKAGQEAEVAVTLLSVKERELPAADDAFAQLASEFDTIKELRVDIEAQLRRAKSYGQGLEAREAVTDALLKLVDVPVSDELIEADVHRHLEGEGRLEDDQHRAEVQLESRKSFQVQMLLDAIVEAESVQVNEQELMQYMMASANQYRMNINEFMKAISENGQLPAFVAEAARRKALSVVLEQATVTDSKGKQVDLSEFLKSDSATSAAPEGDHDHEH